MAKLERFLRRYSWLLKLGVFILLMLWVTKIHGGIFYVWKIEKENRATYDYAVEHNIRQEMKIFVSGLYREIGDPQKYQPEQYFDHLKRVFLKEKELREKYSYFNPVKHRGLEYSNVGSLRRLLDGRSFSDREFGNRMSKAAETFHKWQAEKGFREPIDDEESKREFKEFFSKKMKPWVIFGYLKGILLALILYLTRMAQGQGILKTILSDKKEFFSAIFFWPIYLLDYPGRTWREVHVEAELRRLGDKFRKLSPMEQRLVREVAARSRKEYLAWVENFREANSGKFQRGLLGCVLATLIITALVPIAPAFAGERNIISVGSIVDWDPPPNESPPADMAYLPEFWKVDYFQEVARLFLEEVRILIRVFSRRIDCIPNVGCWVGEMFLSTT